MNDNLLNVVRNTPAGRFTPEQLHTMKVVELVNWYENLSLLAQGRYWASQGTIDPRFPHQTGFVPRLYHDNDDGFFYEIYLDPRRFGIRPGFHWAIGDAIQRMTGCKVIHERKLAGFIETYCEPWTSRPFPCASDIEDNVRPAYSSNITEWWYARDVVAAFLPRKTCDVCGSKMGIPRVPWSRFDGRHSYCGESCVDAGRLLHKIVHDWKYYEVWLEHKQASVCSQQCHDSAADSSRRYSLELKEKGQWVKETRTLLREVRAKSREAMKARRNLEV